MSNLKTSDENPFGKLKPQWKNVHLGEQANQRVYEILMSNPERLFVTSGLVNRSALDREEKKNNIRLLVFENALTGKIQYACYMSVETSDGKMPKKLHYKNVGEFNGTILFYNFNGKLANGWTYADGKLTNRLTAITKKEYDTQKTGQTTGAKAKVMSSNYECTSGWVDKYRWTAVTVGNGNPEWKWTYAGSEYVSRCAWVEQETIDFIAPPEKDEGGGYFPPIYIDCAEVENGKAYWNGACNTCMGGDTGIMECPKEIKDSVQNPCIKTQLNNALTAKTTILTMLKNTFSGTVEFEDLSLTFKDVTTLPDTISGQAKRWSATSIDFEIQLNKNKLPDYSQEYILSTIYHEVLHAYMFSKLTIGADGKYNISTQHESMATDYVILMTGALQIAFPGLSNNEAWALSWGGLEETNLYKKKLTQGQRDAINEINRRHTNKLSTDKQGTYCN